MPKLKSPYSVTVAEAMLKGAKGECDHPKIGIIPKAQPSHFESHPDSKQWACELLCTHCNSREIIWSDKPICRSCSIPETDTYHFMNLFDTVKDPNSRDGIVLNYHCPHCDKVESCIVASGY